MDTAVTIPEDVYTAAERIASRTGRTRDELYTAALAEYVERHDPEAVRDSWNRAVEAVGDDDDSWAIAYSRERLRQVEW